MISLIEALNYRCLRDVRQPLGAFHVLVGPNGSGKTTFFDVVAFLSDVVSGGLEYAIGERTSNFLDLLWRRQGDRFELAIELAAPKQLRVKLCEEAYDTVRYELAFAVGPEDSEPIIAAEQAWLKPSDAAQITGADESLKKEGPRSTILTASPTSHARSILGKHPQGYDYYQRETEELGKTPVSVFRLGARKSTLANLPEDETNFPVSTWLKGLLAEGVQGLVLNSLEMRLASRPWQKKGFRPDGSNLPWMVADLETRHPERFTEWVRHLRTALPDLRTIRTVVREDDRHRYLKLVYNGGLEVPSWTASDGALRIIALTLVAYLPSLNALYLIEEPENGLHPLAIETAYQSLSSVYDGQVLLATHSPLFVSIAEPSEVLCFSKDAEGATEIVSGDQHPRLSDWKGEVDLGTLFASGVLG